MLSSALDVFFIFVNDLSAMKQHMHAKILLPTFLRMNSECIARNILTILRPKIRTRNIMLFWYVNYLRLMYSEMKYTMSGASALL